MLFRSDKTITIPSELVPKRYDMILRIVSDNTELDWGKQDVIDYTPNI